MDIQTKTNVEKMKIKKSIFAFLNIPNSFRERELQKWQFDVISKHYPPHACPSTQPHAMEQDTS